MQIDHKIIKNILIVRNDRFGEFLLNIPALRALKETFLNTKIITVVNSYVRELAKCVPFIDETIEWSRDEHTIKEKLSLINSLKRQKIDIAVMLNPSKEFNIFTYLAGIPIRLGYNRKWGFLLTHKIEDKKYLGLKHEIDYNLELVDLIGAKTNDKTLNLTIDDNLPSELRKFSIESRDNLIALHPWTSDLIKQWPIRNFAQLAQKLIKEPNIKLVIIGGSDELSRSLEFCSNLKHGNLLNLTGKTTLKQLAALLKNCKFLISGDSGPVHLASCVGTKVIAIFRSDIVAKSARRWGPWGQGHVVIEKGNLYDITVEEVFNKFKGALRNK